MLNTLAAQKHSSVFTSTNLEEKWLTIEGLEENGHQTFSLLLLVISMSIIISKVNSIYPCQLQSKLVTKVHLLSQANRPNPSHPIDTY